MYDKWLNPDTPSYMSYYMFDITNAESVSQGGVPVVVQRGPYTYRYISK